MKTLLIDEVPAEVAEAQAILDAALDVRGRWLQQQAEAVAAEPETVRAAEAAASAYERAETDLTVATDENFITLTGLRNEARAEVEWARADLETNRRRQRGIASKLMEAEAAIEAAHPEWRHFFALFQEELRTRFGRHLAAALAGSAGGIVRALRLAYAIEDALGSKCLGELRDLRIRNPAARLGEVPYLLNGHQAWLDDASANAAGDDLRLFEGDAAIAALHKLLAPLGRIETAAAAVMRTIQARHAREVAAAPRPPVPAPPPDPVHAMTDEEYRAHRAAEIDRARLYPAPAQWIFRG
jgi:hypothetical protein